MRWTSGHGVEFLAVEGGLYFGSTPLRWPNTVFKCLCLIHHYSETIYDLAPVFCKSQGLPKKSLFSHFG